MSLNTPQHTEYPTAQTVHTVVVEKSYQHSKSSQLWMLVPISGWVSCLSDQLISIFRAWTTLANSGHHPASWAECLAHGSWAVWRSMWEKGQDRCVCFPVTHSCHRETSSQGWGSHPWQHYCQTLLGTEWPDKRSTPIGTTSKGYAAQVTEIDQEVNQLGLKRWGLGCSIISHSPWKMTLQMGISTLKWCFLT